MDKAIKIMDEIEERHWSDASEEEWQDLRKAVEQQAELLKITEMNRDDLAVAGYDRAVELSQARGRIARLEESHESLIDAIHSLIANKPVRDLDERLARASIVQTNR